MCWNKCPNWQCEILWVSQAQLPWPIWVKWHDFESDQLRKELGSVFYIHPPESTSRSQVLHDSWDRCAAHNIISRFPVSFLKHDLWLIPQLTCRCIRLSSINAYSWKQSQTAADCAIDYLTMWSEGFKHDAPTLTFPLQSFCICLT